MKEKRGEEERRKKEKIYDLKNRCKEMKEMEEIEKK